jgi:hypothetical protein
MPTPIDRAVQQRVGDLQIPWHLLYIVGLLHNVMNGYLNERRVPSSLLPLLLLVSQHGVYGAKISSLVKTLPEVCYFVFISVVSVYGGMIMLILNYRSGDVDT